MLFAGRSPVRLHLYVSNLSHDVCVSVSAAHLFRLHERFKFLDKDNKGHLRLVIKMFKTAGEFDFLTLRVSQNEGKLPYVAVYKILIQNRSFFPFIYLLFFYTQIQT